MCNRYVKNTDNKTYEERKTNGVHMKKDFLYKTAEKIWEQLLRRGRNKKWYSKQVKENLEKLYPFAGSEREKVYYIQKIRQSIILCLAGFFLAAGLGVSALLQPPVKENKIYRPDYGKGAQSVPVEVLTGGKERYALNLNIHARMYGREQLKKLYERAKLELEQAILGENESTEHVEKDLMLVEELPGYPFQIEWESGNYSLIDAEGKLQEAVIPESGEQVGLNAIFTCEDFRAEYLFYIRLYPETLTEKELKEQKILEAVERAEAESGEEEMLFLPTETEGETLSWRSRQDMTWLLVVFGTVGTAFLVYFLKDEDLKKEIKKREEQMLFAYPEMVSRLSIYLGAGMTLKSAWEKICADYERGKGEKGSNAVYEEMNIACQEMKSGMPEMRAYEQFGRRCGVQLYSKFAALLTQNLKKGSTKLGPLLKEESRLAFAERKNAARKAGEEAGTKLLLPMMMMLCVVMMMILLPAFMSF